jgi:hypothetical protein
MLEVKILNSQKRLWSPGPALGDAGPIQIIIIAVLCKNYSVLWVVVRTWTAESR